MPVQPGLRRRRRVGRNEAGIAVGKCHDEKMRPILDAGDDRIRLAKVRLSMARRMGQRHKHLTPTKAPFPNVILHDGLFAREAMFVAKALEYTLRRVVLLTVNRSVLLQNTVDDIREGGQFRAFRWLASPISGGAECRSIFLTVARAMPNRLAASRWLRPSTWQASRTRRYRSTVYILPPSISKKIEGYRWQSFTPPAAGKSRRFRGLICHRRSHWLVKWSDRYWEP